LQTIATSNLNKIPVKPLYLQAFQVRELELSGFPKIRFEPRRSRHSADRLEAAWMLGLRAISAGPKNLAADSHDGFTTNRARGAGGFTMDRLMHGRDYSGGECAGWLWQRKWDGVFAGWDGERLWSKPSAKYPRGNVVHAPDFFLAGLPDFPLCCELLAATEGANFANGLMRQRRSAREWERGTLRIFDAPGADDPNVAARLARAACAFPGTRHAEFTRTATLDGRAHLRAELRAVLDAGGEGLMIQPARCPYTPGRTGLLQKVKRQSLHFFRNLKPTHP
jgi:hypothetical protein